MFFNMGFGTHATQLLTLFGFATRSAGNPTFFRNGIENNREARTVSPFLVQPVHTSSTENSRRYQLANVGSNHRAALFPTSADRTQVSLAHVSFN